MKKSDCYIFTFDSNHDQMLRRESITRFVIKIIQTVSEKLPDKQNITIKVRYRIQLWKDTKDKP
jgi:hypothetical protein